MKISKNSCGILIIIIFFINLFYPEYVFANGDRKPKSDREIKLDGKFEEWQGMHVIYDRKGDAPEKEDIHEVRYFTDNNYLYLNIKRKSDIHYNDKWDFEVLLLDTPSGNKTTHYIYKDGKVTSFMATTFQVSVYKTDYKEKGCFVVKVSKDNNPIETTFSCGTGGENIEFKIPLKLAGLEGPKNIIKFLIKSNLKAPYIYQIEYVPDFGPVLISTIPALGNSNLEFCFFLIIVILIYRFCNKKDIKYVEGIERLKSRNSK